jgi:hypothetical protein
MIVQKYRWILTLAIVLVVASAGGHILITRAASNTSFTGGTSYTAVFTPDTNDGDGLDWVCVVCYDANGDPTDVDTDSAAPGAGEQTWNDTCHSTLGTGTQPVSSAFGDPTTARPTSNDNNAENVTWCITAASGPVDSDNDGVPDDQDQCPNDPGPAEFDGCPDSDGDGVPDHQDQCPGSNDNVDVDGDGIPDGCDALIDSDGDGVADDVDQCPGHDDNVDVDGDGIPDGCDGMIDSDGDGVADDVDQCPGHDDAIDVDKDGVPDGCDDLIDSDFDGVGDDVDLCPDVYYPGSGCPPPGRDMVPMPDQAVVGTFIDWTPLMYAPVDGANSPYTMEPGQTLWIFGMDETHEFYQVLMSGDLYWVPKDNMEPTYPYPWYGTPLPTEVVD